MYVNIDNNYNGQSHMGCEKTVERLILYIDNFIILC